MERNKVVEAAREFKLNSNTPEAELFQHFRIIQLMADFAIAHASHLQERLDEAEKVVDECKGFTNLTAGKLASRYRERYPKE